MTLLADARELANEAIAAALMPPPPIDYLEWARANIVFSDGEPLPGPFDARTFPYFSEILRALSPADPCRYVTLVASAQCGKTTLAEIFALGSVMMGRGLTLVCASYDRQCVALVETEASAEDAHDASRARALPSAFARRVGQPACSRMRADGLASYPHHRGE